VVVVVVLVLLVLVVLLLLAHIIPLVVLRVGGVGTRAVAGGILAPCGGGLWVGGRRCAGAVHDAVPQHISALVTLLVVVSVLP